MLSLVLSAAVGSAGAAPALSVTGTCPGVADAVVSAATPGGQVAIVSGSRGGATTIPAGTPCAGTQLDLASATLRAVRVADALGVVALAPSLPAVACSADLQVLDVATCSVSAVRAVGRSCVSDDFERPSLGPDWSLLMGSDASIVDGSNLGFGLNWVFAQWSGAALGLDQSSEVEVAPGMAPNALVQAYARRRSTDDARYACHYNADPGDAQWEIKYDGVPTPQTRILAESGATPPPGPGTRVRIEVQETNPVRIWCFVDDLLALYAEDAAPDRVDDSNHGGAVARATVGTSTPTGTPIVAWWEGCDL